MLIFDRHSEKMIANRSPQAPWPCPQWTLLNGSAFIFGQCLFNRHQYRGSTAVLCTRKPKYSCDRHLEPHRDSFILWGLALEWKAVLPGEVDEVMSLTEVAGGRGRGGDRRCSSTARPPFSLPPCWMEQASVHHPSEFFWFVQTPLRRLSVQALLWSSLSDGTDESPSLFSCSCSCDECLRAEF